jgi:hypothetical protein
MHWRGNCSFTKHNHASKMASKQKVGKKNFLIEFKDVTNEEGNKIVKFIKNPDYPTLVDKSKKLHCMIISLFYHKDRQDNYNQNMRVRLKLCF